MNVGAKFEPAERSPTSAVANVSTKSANAERAERDPHAAREDEP